MPFDVLTPLSSLDYRIDKIQWHTKRRDLEDPKTFKFQYG